MDAEQAYQKIKNCGLPWSALDPEETKQKEAWLRRQAELLVKTNEQRTPEEFHELSAECLEAFHA